MNVRVQVEGPPTLKIGQFYSVGQIVVRMHWHLGT